MIMMIALCFSSLGITTGHAADAQDYAQVRTKWKQLLTGGELTSAQLADPNIQANITSIESSARSYWSSMDKDSGRTAIWYGSSFEYAPGKSLHFSQSYSRLQTMARAYAQSGTTFTTAERAALKNDIINAMDWIYTNWYNPSIIPDPPSITNLKAWPGNWFDYQISAPMSINNILVLMYDDFTPAQISQYADTILHYNTDLKYGGGQGGTLMKGANLAYKATVYLLTGANTQTEAPLLELGDEIGTIFEYETEYPDDSQRDQGDGGFYEDGSYIQHYAFPYIGGYGLTLMNLLPRVIYALHGSPWEITDPNQANMYQWVYDSIAPFMYRGAIMDMVRGREVAYPTTTDHSRGTAMTRNLLLVAESAPPADALKIRRLLKYWIETNTYRSIYTTATVFDIVLLNELLSDPLLEAAATPLMNKAYPMMDRVVHHRSDFGFGVSMHSSRIKNYELINNQNLRGWYQGEGMTYLYTNDLAQYSNQYWATIYKQRLAGTTVDVQTLNPAQYAGKFSEKDWVGGTSIGGDAVSGGASLYGAAGMDLKNQAGTLTGKKSWFMFDDEIAALGAGITGTGSSRIDTIVDNRMILPDTGNAFTVNGAAPALPLGQPQVQQQVSWAHLQGNVPGSDIGYYFPGTPGVTMLKETRTGQWSSMTKYESDYKTVSLAPVKDAYVHQGTRGNENFGGKEQLIVKGSTIADHARKSYLTFNLSGISEIVSAKLMVFGSNTQDSSVFPVEVRGVSSDSWSESAVTWNNSPAPEGNALSTTVVDAHSKYYEWDVTDYIRAQAAGDQTATLLLQDASGADRMFTGNSREAAYNQPQLVIRTDPVYTGSFASLTLRHGVQPVNADYSYVLLPAKNAADTEAYVKQPDVTIIRNDAQVQAVREKQLQVTAANFWQASGAEPQTAGMITAKAPASVMTQEHPGGLLEVSVADPTHLQTGAIEVELGRSAVSYTADPGVTVTSLNPIVLQVDVNQAQGKSFRIQFQTLASTPVELPVTADAYVRDGTYANTVFDGASDPFLRAKVSTLSYSRKAYLKFDASGISNVRSAKLRLFGLNNENATGIYLRVLPVLQDNWSESSVTWNNAPVASAFPLDTVQATNQARYYEWDVTDFVQGQLKGDQVISLLLIGDISNFLANSRENSANPPVLLIE
jgi:hypothetical protein